MPDSQLNKLKSATSNLSSNLIGDSNDNTNFPHKLLLTNTQVSRTRKASANGSSANVKFSKTHLFNYFTSFGSTKGKEKYRPRNLLIKC